MTCTSWHVECRARLLYPLMYRCRAHIQGFLSWVKDGERATEDTACHVCQCMRACLYCMLIPACCSILYRTLWLSVAADGNCLLCLLPMCLACLLQVRDVRKVLRGRVTDLFIKRSVPALTPDEQCFSVVLRNDQTLDFQCRSEVGRQSVRHGSIWPNQTADLLPSGLCGC